MQATPRDRAIQLLDAVFDAEAKDRIGLLETALTETPLLIARSQIEALVIEIFEDLDKWARAEPWSAEEVFSMANVVERFMTKPVGVKK